MAKDDRHFSKTGLTPMERLRQAALEDMDGVEILTLLKQIEKEIKRRGR
ncbi:hypothetical protein [Bradyrhizobium centrosematis]|nr:hypothetical protein [Bradyrhizobium centrosematis]MCS3763190.1 hypothetical protein [Bradyrhizobium centrosematis]MCS3775857.1 hypothetical protein [Bradyrhizobium centrosematis]